MNSNTPQSGSSILTGICALLLAFSLSTSPRAAAASEVPAANSTNDALFTKCTEIIKYGERINLAKPTKADAIVTLGMLGDERAIPLLIEYYDHEDNNNMRHQLVKALSWIGGSKVVPTLEKALRDKYPFTRKQAAVGLKEITGKDYEFDTTGLPDLAKMRAAIESARDGATKAP